MSILLTTPFNPGDLDPGKTYSRAIITDYAIHIHDWNEPSMVIGYTYGDTVDGVWVRGAAAPMKTVSAVGADYEAIVAEVATEDDDDYKIYVAARRVLYGYLLDKGYLVGTIE